MYMAYIPEKIMEWFGKVRYAHTGHIRDVSLAEFGVKPDKAMEYVKSLCSAGKLATQFPYIRLAALQRQEDEVFPWEK